MLSALHSLDLFQRAVYPEPVQLSQCQSRQRRAGTWTFLENVFLRAVVELLLFCSAAGIFMPYHAGRADGDSRDGKQQCHHIPGDAHFETADTAGAVELFVLRNAHLPEVALPEPIPLSRSAKPIRRSTALVTAGCFTVAALGLNLSYVYSVFTGKANFQLALFQNPTVMAHRGLSADAPENTLYAFSDAISVGADFIELDVQQTKDGVLVVMHDSNLKRTTGVNKDIWDVNYADIQDLDAGSWFDPAYANARIPTLEETLQFVDKRAKLNIEIKPTKHGSDTLEQDVANLITEYHYTDACYVTSFSYGSLKKVKEVNPDIRTGYLMSVAYGQFYSLQYADAFSLNKVFVTSQVVNAAHQQGKQIFAWTVNSVSEVRSLCNLHVDSIITDDPVMVQNVVSRDSTSETLRSVLDYFIN